MPPAPVFTAELKPHRSLAPRGFLLLMLGVILINTAAGVGFWLAGAWPVVGFCGLEVALLYGAFRFSYAQAAAREYLILREDALTIRTVTARGQEHSWQFQPYWLRVDCDPADEEHSLTLRSHGRALRVGRFLSPAERWELAEALRAALARLREPDGAGLRELGTA